MNTATSDRLIDSTVKPTSRAPSSTAFMRGMPASMCREMFSSTTTASSTTNPVATVSAISDRLSRLKPARYMIENVPISDTGTATAGINVARQLRRKQNTTRMTSSVEITSVFSTSRSDARIVLVRSIAMSILMSAGIDLPRKVFAHGFLLNKGEKMSKSVGNIVDPDTLVDTFGLDQVRYFLLREVPFGQDGSYSEDAIITRINADLANELGNLAQRSLSMVAKNLGGVVPEPGEFTAADTELLTTADGLLERVRATFDAQAMHLALEAIWLMLGEANKYFSAQQPWVLRKSESDADQARFRTVLYTTCEAVRIAALLVQPVMPESAVKLLDLLGQAEDQRAFTAVDARLAPGTVLPAPTGVFPRYQPTPDAE